jgi:hypothetical protein
MDGRLLGMVKRKELPDSVKAGGTESEKFSFARYIATLGISLDEVKGAEFLSDDDVAARYVGTSWSASKNALTFGSARRQQGKITMAAEADPTKDAVISSVQLYSRTTPPKRSASPVDFLVLSDDARGSQQPDLE